MGGVVEGGVGIVNKTSPRRAAIEKVQSELRQEYDVREKRKRELDFLEKGGNPLDFKLGNAASLSVQSTSFTDQHPDQFVAREAKGSFALNASPHGDSVESSGRPGELPCEPNSADNLLLLDAEHEFSEGDPNSLHPNRSNILPSEQSSQMGGSHKAREHGNSTAFGLPRKAYKRRNRSRPNRDGTRSSSTDVNPIHGSHGSSLPSHHSPRDVKALVSDAEIQNVPSNWNSKPTSPLDSALCKAVSTDGQQDMELDGSNAVESTKDLIEGVSASDAVDEQLNQQSLSGAAKIPIEMDSSGPEAIPATEEMNSTAIECQPSFPTTKVENQSSSSQMNGFSHKKGDGMASDDRNISASHGIKALDSESSSTQANFNADGNTDELCIPVKNHDSNGNIKIQNLVPDNNPVIEPNEFIEEKKENNGVNSDALANLGSTSVSQSQLDNRLKLQPEEELQRNESALKVEMKDFSIIKKVEDCGPPDSESEKKPTEQLDQNVAPQSETYVRHNDSVDTTTSDLHDDESLSRVSKVLDEQSSVSDSKLADKVDEDSILKEAQIIEAKRKRIEELSMSTYATEIRQKSHWNYVLEEMAWLANDFAQERIWKIASAAQICNQAAFASQLRKQRKHSGTEVKKVAHALAKAVMEFWHSVEERSKELGQQNEKNGAVSVQAYAVRFMKYNNLNIFPVQAVVPETPDRISDSGIQDLSWKDNLTEEILFYTIPPGAMETYRKSIECHLAQYERFGSVAQEEVDTSACDAATDFEYQDNSYAEDDGETSTYDMSVAYDGSRSSRFGQKKRKHLTHAYGPRSYEVGPDVLPTGTIVVTQQSSLLAKRPDNSLNASIPTKRMRTASRRVISPFSAGTSGCIQLPKQTDASSGDTNSFQDDHSTLHGGSFVPNGLDIESTGDFEKQLQFESAEVSTKPKKKKKAKHQNVAYEQRWQVDSSFQHEQIQRENFRKRPESHQLESNGSSGLLGHPMIKKPKIMRPSQDNSFENITPISGSGPSPVASQMSNMSNPNKFIKMLGGRDRGRKPKALKMPAGQPGSGTAWSLFEEQALVVLAHDLGPNWELVSDAINSTLHFKCIFRKAKECKEKHNMLMDRTSVDGADSAEDSGSSQPYPSTLPGIPKGSARQLFQRLQGPMEEDTLKSHFEKIIMIGQKQHYRKTQDPKQLQPPHSSHTIALSEACPSNLTGGPILTPLDLCDATIPGPDILSLGYQGPHSSGLANPNQGPVAPIHSASGASSTLQGSPNMMHGNNFPSSPGSLNSSVRDGRYVVPRPASLSADEQQRMQQYNHMVSGRNISNPNISAPGSLLGNDRGVRILPGGNGMGMVCGINRSMPMARPGLQGIASSSMVNSGSMVSPGMPPATLHSGIGSGQGNSMLRPRDAAHMMRPPASQDSQRQMVVPPDLQVPGNSQGVSHFGGLSSPFPNQTPHAPYPVHHQLSHPISPQQPQVHSPHHPHFQGPAHHSPNPQQQAYAIRMAKERQMQHRFLQQQQQPKAQQFASSNSLMPHAQSQPQLPISSPMQNSSQVQPQTSSPIPVSPLTPASPMNSMAQQKHLAPSQGAVRNAQVGGSGITNPSTSKQRQRQQQQFSHVNRQHPQQKQQSQAQQQAKIAKGVGRGNLMVNQNIPMDTSLLNGVSTNPGNQGIEKGEPAHLIQSQSLYTGSAHHAVQPSRQYQSSQSSNPSLPQQKMYSGQSSLSSKHLNQMTSHSDNSSQGHGHQSVPSLAMVGSSHKQPSSHKKSVNQNQLAPQRVVQPNRQINSDLSNKQRARESNTDVHPTSSSSAAMDTLAALPQASNTATSTVHIVTPAIAPHHQASEQLLDSKVLTSAVNLSSLVSTSPNSTESETKLGQGVGQRPSSDLLSNKHDASAHPQQKSQQPLPTNPHPHQQTQLLQVGNVNLHGKPNEPRSE